MPSQEQLEHYAKREASSPSSVCEHVLNGANVEIFGNGGICWFAACCEDCLYTGDQVTIITKHLTDRQPELAALFHLPIYASAILRGGNWHLEIMKLTQTLSESDNGVYTKQTVDEFKSSAKDYFFMAVSRYIHETTFENGSRFIPVWCSELDAKIYKKRMGLLPRIYTGIKKAEAKEIVNMALEDGHNYLCIQEGPLRWESIIVDGELDIEKNTLIL